MDGLSIVTAGLSPLIRGAHDGACFPHFHSGVQLSSVWRAPRRPESVIKSDPSTTTRAPRRRIVELGLSLRCSVFVLKSELLDPTKPEHLDPTRAPRPAPPSTGSDPPARPLAPCCRWYRYCSTSRCSASVLLRYAASSRQPPWHVTVGPVSVGPSYQWPLTSSQV